MNARLLFVICLPLVIAACASSEPMTDEQYMNAVDRQDQEAFDRVMNYK